MSFEIRTIDPFERELKKLSKKYPSVKNDILDLAEELIDNPLMGVPLGRDCYKIRMSIPSKNKGKSGGSRIITCVKILDEKIFLLSIYDKSEQEDIDDKRLDNLLKINDLL